MSIPRSRFKKRWVFIQFSEDGEWQRAFIRKMGYECGFCVYDLAWEDGRTEFVFVGSVHRIVDENPKKARIVDFEKRRLKRIKLV
jgi:hypothetical protein